MTDAVAGGLDDRRSAVLAGGLVAAVVVVLAFGSGLLSHDAADLGAAPAGRNLGTVVQPSGDGRPALGGEGAPLTGAGRPDLLGTPQVARVSLPDDAATAPAASPSTSSFPAAGASASTTSTTTAASLAPASCSAGAIAPFWEHLERGHLEASPSQQVADASDLDQYVATHTVLLEQMLSPIVGSLFGSPGSGGGAFWSHLRKGHLEASPSQQVADVLDLDHYVQTHTVLVEDLASPIVGGC